MKDHIQIYIDSISTIIEIPFSTIIDILLIWYMFM